MCRVPKHITSEPYLHGLKRIRLHIEICAHCQLFQSFDVSTLLPSPDQFI